MALGKKRAVTENVFTLAVERLRRTYGRFDKVVYACSGGKDSSACVNVGLRVARELGKLPIDVFHFDEEAIPPETVEYCARLAANPDIRFRWLCLPVKHRNACSRSSPEWYPWAEEDRGKWVRELPPGAVTADQCPWFRRGLAIPECAPLLWDGSHGTVANGMGIRCQESMTRYSSVATKTGFECFTIGTEWKYMSKVYPIYDWSLDDVWVAPEKFGWDYNRAYDLMQAAGVSRSDARCSPPFGEQPIRRLWSYKLCWPGLWAKMVDRVPGAATAARYANTELYGVGVQEGDLPPGLTWEGYTMATIAKLDAAAAREVARAIRTLIGSHKKFYNWSGYAAVPIPDQTPDALTGYSWKLFSTIAAAGGNKFDRQRQKADIVATRTRKKSRLCVTKAEAAKRAKQAAARDRAATADPGEGESNA